MDGSATKREDGIRAVSKALMILEAFTREQPVLSLKEISKKTGFYKSTILRQIETLSGAGYISRDMDTGRYRLGAKVYFLGQVYLKSSSLLETARPVLKEVVRQLQETAGIFVVDGIERLCLTMEQGPHFIRATFETGCKLPIHAGASGKVLLAFSEKALFERVAAETGLPGFTRQTITDLQELKAELARIKQLGYAFSRGERVPSAATVSVPIFGADEGLVCSLSTSGPIDRFKEKLIPGMIAVLQRAAEKMSRELGYQGDYWQKRRSGFSVREDG